MYHCFGGIKYLFPLFPEFVDSGLVTLCFYLIARGNISPFTSRWRCVVVFWSNPRTGALSPLPQCKEHRSIAKALPLYCKHLFDPMQSLDCSTANMRFTDSQFSRKARIIVRLREVLHMRRVLLCPPASLRR